MTLPFCQGMMMGGAGGTVWTPATLPNFNAGDSGYTGYTLRQNIGAALIPGNGTKIRFSVLGGYNDSGWAITKCYIGLKGSGNYDFATTPTQVLFGGNTSVVAPSGTKQWSDEITLSVTTSDSLVIAFYTGAGNGAQDSFSRYVTNTASSFLAAYKAGDDAVTQTVSGYTALGGGTYCHVLEDFEVGN